MSRYSFKTWTTQQVLDRLDDIRETKRAHDRVITHLRAEVELLDAEMVQITEELERRVAREETTTAIEALRDEWMG